MCAIAGVSGHTGKVVAEVIQAKGYPIRVIVRDENKGSAWKERVAAVAKASLDDEASLARAMSGAKTRRPRGPSSRQCLLDRCEVTFATRAYARMGVAPLG